MDNNSLDLEFFNFENASEEEIKEIHAILKGPGNNGSVELPWKTLKNSSESLAKNEKEGTINKSAPVVCSKNLKSPETVVGQTLHFTSQAPLSQPVAQVPPPTVEAFIAPPTSMGPYPSPPYIVSRTIPYLRAYPHMGMPFFACPIPGAAGDASYGQFVPVVPATVGQETLIDSESSQKIKPSDKQFTHQSKKKYSSDYSSSFTSETSLNSGGEAMQDEGLVSASSPISAVVNSERPTSVPIVPLPVPQPTFGVAGGTIPLHGYPPGLHTLPYTHMSGPQAPSAAMYYVPVFNHPYNSYLPSPSAPIVLPVNLHPETDTSSPVNAAPLVPPTSVAKSSEVVELVQSNCEPLNQCSAEDPLPVDSAAKSVSEGEDMIDCTSSSDCPTTKSPSSSPDCISDPPITGDGCSNNNKNKDAKQTAQDPSRCWADLFKKPLPEVNGIDCRLAVNQRHGSDKELYTNGKDYASASDIN